MAEQQRSTVDGNIDYATLACGSAQIEGVPTVAACECGHSGHTHDLDGCFAPIYRGGARLGNCPCPGFERASARRPGNLNADAAAPIGRRVWTCPSCAVVLDGEPYAFRVCERCYMRDRRLAADLEDAIAALQRALADVRERIARTRKPTVDGAGHAGR